MISERERFDQVFELFEMPEPAFERLGRRRDRKRRTERLAAGVAACAILVAVAAIFGRAWFSSEPVVVDEPKPIPQGWARVDSGLYGYSIGVPSDWTFDPATTPWRWGERSQEDGRPDAWYSPTSISLQVASQAIPEDVTDEEWFEHGEYRRWVDPPDSCDVRSTEPIEVDGVAGTLTRNCLGDAPWWKGNDALEVALTSDGRGYTIWFMSRGDFDERRQLFEEILATIDLRPDDARDTTAGSGWRGIWPQPTQAEAEAAQSLADAGDPGVVWQLDPGENGAEAIGKRFVLEYLGWSGARVRSISYGPLHSGTEWSDASNLSFIRCAEGRTNAAYPEERCAPTNGNTYEHVSVRLEQLVRPEPTGIWIVTRWFALPGYTQAQPMSEEETRSFVEGFLDARVTGAGADVYFHPDQGPVEFPLLYATSSGASFERFEIVDIGDPSWPYGMRQISFRLLARGGTVVVEQTIMVHPGGDSPSRWDNTLSGEFGPWLSPVWGSPTTENGEVIDDGLS